MSSQTDACRDWLNKAATDLIALDPGDNGAIKALCAELQSLSAGVSPSLRGYLTDAVAVLQRALELDPSRRASTIERAGTLLECAMNDAPAPQPEKAAADGAGPARLPEGIELDLLEEFISESRTNLESAEGALLQLETDPHDKESIDLVFRAVHTIKGTSVFLNIAMITDFAHQAETLLVKIRDGKIQFAGVYADLALRAVDMLNALAQSLEDAIGGGPLNAPAGYRELLDLLRSTGSGPGDEPKLARLGDILIAEGLATRNDVELAEAIKGEQPLGVSIVRSGAAGLSDVAQALRTQQELNHSGQTSETFVRVRTERLDRIIDAIGELVIAQSMVAQDEIVRSDQNRGLLRKISHAGKIVRELQDIGMAMRMVPLKATFQKMTRLARDVARKSGKEIEVHIDGEETEIDRNMVSVVDELLVHMVRNAVDHGLEQAEDRIRAGKPPRGALYLASYHSGGNVIFDIKDDGRGLNREKIIRKAIEKDLIASADGLSDREIFDLIFVPGFSTADKLTDVSGRGVGMDVVKNGVESLRGAIDIKSREGAGCEFSLKVPLTLAITDGMLVKVGEQRYIIPTIQIQRSLRPSRSDLHTVYGGGEIVMLAGQPVPIVRLHKVFDVRGAVEDPTQALLVILEEGGRRAAVLVDALLHQQQVVAKGLGEGVGKVIGLSGGAILGDGRVGLIIDPPGLMELAMQEPLELTANGRNA